MASSLAVDVITDVAPPTGAEDAAVSIASLPTLQNKRKRRRSELKAHSAQRFEIDGLSDREKAILLGRLLDDDNRTNTLLYAMCHLKRCCADDCKQMPDSWLEVDEYESRQCDDCPRIYCEDCYDEVVKGKCDGRKCPNGSGRVCNLCAAGTCEICENRLCGDCVLEDVVRCAECK